VLIGAPTRIKFCAVGLSMPLGLIVKGRRRILFWLQSLMMSGPQICRPLESVCVLFDLGIC
jgi:hypothetical protein